MSEYKLTLSELAVEDVNEVIVWYQKQQPGLEYQFLFELQRNYQKVIVHPEMYGYYRIARHLRYVQMKRFPYYILFTVEENVILIAGIVHTSRSPRFVRSRYR